MDNITPLPRLGAVRDDVIEDDKLLRNPHIFLSAKLIPVGPQYQQRLGERLRRFQPQSIEFDKHGFYVIFPDTTLGQENALRCYKSSNEMPFYGCRMTMKYRENGLSLREQMQRGDIRPSGTSPKSIASTQMPSNQDAAQNSVPLPQSNLSAPRFPPSRAAPEKHDNISNRVEDSPLWVLKVYNMLATKANSKHRTTIAANNTQNPMSAVSVEAKSVTPSIRREQHALTDSHGKFVDSLRSARSDDEISLPSEITNSDIPSSTSCVSSRKCWECRRVDSPMFNPIVKCSSCRRRWHAFCNKPQITKEEQISSVWQCHVCVKHGRQPTVRKRPRSPEGLKEASIKRLKLVSVKQESPEPEQVSPQPKIRSFPLNTVKSQYRDSPALSDEGLSFSTCRPVSVVRLTAHGLNTPAASTSPSAPQSIARHGETTDDLLDHFDDHLNEHKPTDDANATEDATDSKTRNGDGSKEKSPISIQRPKSYQGDEAKATINAPSIIVSHKEASEVGVAALKEPINLPEQADDHVDTSRISVATQDCIPAPDQERSFISMAAAEPSMLNILPPELTESKRFSDTDSELSSLPPDIDESKTAGNDTKLEKPVGTWVQLINAAFEKIARSHLTSNEVCTGIMKAHPFYAKVFPRSSLSNSVSATLSQRPEYQKHTRETDDGRKIASCLWSINTDLQVIKGKSRVPSDQGGSTMVAKQEGKGKSLSVLNPSFPTLSASGEDHNELKSIRRRVKDTTMGSTRFMTSPKQSTVIPGLVPQALRNSTQRTSAATAAFRPGMPSQQAPLVHESGVHRNISNGAPSPRVTDLAVENALMRQKIRDLVACGIPWNTGTTCMALSSDLMDEAASAENHEQIEDSRSYESLSELYANHPLYRTHSTHKVQPLSTLREERMSGASRSGTHADKFSVEEKARPAILRSCGNPKNISRTMIEGNIVYVDNDRAFRGPLVREDGLYKIPTSQTQNEAEDREFQFLGSRPFGRKRIARPMNDSDPRS